MYILSTRPKSESEEIAVEFATYGLQTVIDPLIMIKSIENWQESYLKIDKTKIGLIAFTSSNGIKEFASFEKDRDCTIAVVGKKSRLKAEFLGFKNIIEAKGNALSLLNLLKERKNDGKILYIAGEDITVEIADELQKIGVDAHKITVYQSLMANNFSTHVLQLLIEQKISAILLFSLRTAENFIELVNKSSIKIDLTNTKVFALSEKIAKVVENLNCYGIYVADEATTEAIVNLVKQNIYGSSRKRKVY